MIILIILLREVLLLFKNWSKDIYIMKYEEFVNLISS